jgi:hypothetical protein
VYNDLLISAKMTTDISLFSSDQESFNFESRLEDTKGVIRIRKSKNRQPNDQKNKDKQRSTKHTNKTKDPVIQTSLNTWGELL